jgi:uncharacterized coiled-coil protein SlyX
MDKRVGEPGDERRNRADSTDGLLQKVYTLLKNTYNEMKSLKDTVGKQENMIQELQRTTKEQHTTIQEQHITIQELQEHLKQVREQLEVMSNSPFIVNSIQTSPHRSYADIARTPPTSHPNNLPSLSSTKTIPSTFANTLYCTIDTSRVAEEHKPKTQVAGIRQTIEKEMRTREGQEKWRCVAVVKDAKKADRVKVICSSVVSSVERTRKYVLFDD